jgi:hypothetical protein
VVRKCIGRGGGGEAYQFIDVPAAMLASLNCIGHSMRGLEVPIHVGSFLLLAFFVGVETSPTLVAGLAKLLVKIEDEMRSRSGEW